MIGSSGAKREIDKDSNFGIHRDVVRVPERREEVRNSGSWLVLGLRERGVVECVVHVWKLGQGCKLRPVEVTVRQYFS